MAAMLGPRSQDWEIAAAALEQAESNSADSQSVLEMQAGNIPDGSSRIQGKKSPEANDQFAGL